MLLPYVVERLLWERRFWQEFFLRLGPWAAERLRSVFNCGDGLPPHGGVLPYALQQAHLDIPNCRQIGCVSEYVFKMSFSITRELGNPYFSGC